jgi:hypothetical protein
MLDGLTWLFLESPAALGICLGLMLFGLLVHWRRTLKPRPLLVGMAVALVLMIVQKVVVTQREEAGLILDAIQADLLASRSDAIERSLHDPFTAGRMDRDEFLRLVREKLRTVRIITLSRSELVVTTRDAAGSFDVEAAFVSRVNVGEFGQYPIPTRWMLRFVRDGERWRIRQIEPISLGGRGGVNWMTYGGD